jgi:hypothetical protein
VPSLLKIDEGFRQHPNLCGDGESGRQSFGDTFLERPATEGLAGFLHDPVGEGPTQYLAKRSLAVLRPDLDAASLVDQEMKHSIVDR